jgi:endonuclease G
MIVDLEVARGAGERWEGRRAKRDKQVARLRASGVTSVESEKRIQLRLERLASAATRESAQRSAPRAAVPASVERIGLERVIGKKDFLGVQFLEMAAAVSRFVARVHVRERAAQTAGFGTGFMVSPRLLMTNNHVLPSEEAARFSEAEFDFQNDRLGRPLPVMVYGLEPDTFFATSEELDYSLVAVSPRSTSGRDLKTYAWTRLDGQQGKALLGDSLNIIQHPRGELKQIVLRSNELVDLLDDFAHYVTDTEPGSSGSPVFNDQWEVVALHHSGVPRTKDGKLIAKDGSVWEPGMDPDLLDWVANEGVRVSRLVDHIKGLSVNGEQARLRDELLTLEPPHPFESATLANGNGNGKGKGDAAGNGKANGNGHGHSDPPAAEPAAAEPAHSGLTTWTIPLRVTVDLGAPARVASLDVAPAISHGYGGAAAVVSSSPRPAPPMPDLDAGGPEAIRIDPDYTTRRGYAAEFLGTGARRVPLPRLSTAQRQKAALNRQANDDDPVLLPYHHFTVVMNRERRLAFYTAVNIDGRIRHNFRREKDRWSRDPRIGADDQTGEELYSANDLDRGHLVRRLDPVWGSSRDAAKAANDDTFHFTNCTPQHKSFNQNRTTWAGLEDYILENADVEDIKATVFTGPVLDEDDPEYRGVQLPRQFWKVVAIARSGGGLSATGYLLSQARLITDLEAFTYGAYRTFQVPVHQIETVTGLDLGALRSSDPLGADEGVHLEADTVAAREIQHFGQIRL